MKYYRKGASFGFTRGIELRKRERENIYVTYRDIYNT